MLRYYIFLSTIAQELCVANSSKSHSVWRIHIADFPVHFELIDFHYIFTLRRQSHALEHNTVLFLVL